MFLIFLFYVFIADAEKETVDNSLPQSDASTVALLQQQVNQLSNMVNMLKIQVPMKKGQDCGLFCDLLVKVTLFNQK